MRATAFVLSISLVVVLPGRLAAADPAMIDTIGIFDTSVQTYTTSEKPPTWVPELKVIVQVDGFANEDVLVYQLKQGAKKIGPPNTCSASTNVKAPEGALSNEKKAVDLVFFDCKPGEKQGVTKGGAYAIELSYKQPLAGKEFKAFATLHFNVIVAKQGNFNDPWNHYMENMDDRLPVSLLYESMVREYGTSSADRMISYSVQVATGQVGQKDVASHVVIRTWIKEGETTMPQTTMSCMYNGKKVAEGGDYPAVQRDYVTFVKKGKDKQITERWIQKQYKLEKLKFDPPCGWEKYKKSNMSMDRFWLSKNPGEYRCVIMGGGEILKELFFTVGTDGKIVQSPCMAKVNTLRQVRMLTSKDTKISNVKYDKKMWKMGFSRVTWDPGCPTK